MEVFENLYSLQVEMDEAIDPQQARENLDLSLVSDFLAMKAEVLGNIIILRMKIGSKLVDHGMHSKMQPSDESAQFASWDCGHSRKKGMRETLRSVCNTRVST